MTTPEESVAENIAHTKRLNSVVPHGSNYRDAIRRKCIDCQGGEIAEIARCEATYCALWPFRMRRNPFRSPTKKAVAEGSE